jgi:N utilization substance protein B
MAVQMLYQRDLGGADCRQIFADFQPTDYLPEGRGSRAARAVTETKPVTGNSSVSGNNPASDNGSGRPGGPASEAAGSFVYAKSLVEGTLDHLAEIDDLIRQQAEHWRLERMPAVDRNILRLAVFEFLYESDVPKLVILDEAIELAKEFGSDQSGRFVNGVLDGILKSHSFPGTMT